SGIRYQLDRMKDRIYEFSALDTSGYSLPHTGNWAYMDLVNQRNSLDITKLSGFLQNTYQVSPFTTLIAGFRANYNSFSRELLFSPRISLTVLPGFSESLVFRFGAGRYVQSPVYHEIRNYDGSLNDHFRSQQSWQITAGSDYEFNGLGTRLRFSS